MTSPLCIPPSVRLALPRDAAAVAKIQRKVAEADLPDGLREATLAAYAEGNVAQLWQQMIEKPEIAPLRILVAIDRDHVVGYALVGPSEDPDGQPGDGQLGELAVLPGHRRQGHGSRLLQAAVDTMRRDGATRALVWVRSADDISRRFLAGAGFEPDGAHMELGSHLNDEVRVKFLRYYAGI